MCPSQRATVSHRPQEFVLKEEQEVRRQSSVNPRAMSLASQHRRFSLMNEAGRGSVDNGSAVDEKEMENERKEEV